MIKIRVTHLMSVTLIGATLILTACGGGSGGSSSTPDTPGNTSTQTPIQRMASLENSGAIPKLDRSNVIGGTDVNANGIRDDIDAILTATYPQAPQRAAAVQLAKVMQAALLEDKTNIVAVKAISVRGSRAVNCVYRVFDGSNGSKQPALVITEIEAMTANTKARMLAYLAYNKALDGTSGTLPEGDTCE